MRYHDNDRWFGFVILIWLFSLLLTLGFWGVIIWAIIKLVNAVTN